MMKQTEAPIALIRVRGDVNLTGTVRTTLDMLRLRKKNVCVLHKATPTLTGMLRKVKDYITWGTLNAETEMLLKKKRASAHESVFFLAPPRKGYGRKGIKKSFVVGGALGERHEKLNDLIQRMI